MTTEEKARKYDELMDNINTLEKMYVEALDKYPNSTSLIKEKIMVLKLVKS